jgi:thiol-disulfide isomerase/thioredoxin
MNWKTFILALTLTATAALAWYLSPLRSGGSPSIYLGEGTPAQIMAHIRGLNAPLVLVNFWASWCEPCKVEFPHILKLKETYANKGLQVLFVSVDETADQPVAEKFLRDQKVDFPTFYKGKQSLKFVAELFPKWSGAVPATVLFGPDGQIVDAWEGDTSLEEFEAKITPHLKSP